MRKTFIIAAVVLCAGAGALADDMSSMDQSMNQMTGKLGVGFIFGEPIGVSAKYFFNDTWAVDGALGWSPIDHAGFAFHADALWHNFNLLPGGSMPFYVGVGGLFRERTHGEGNQVGIRVPVGVAYQFNAPVDIFAEVAPALDVAPFTRGEITGAVGVRFWF